MDGGSNVTITNQSSSTTRASISRKLRFSILQKYGFKCRYCGRGHPEIAIQVLQIDHVVSICDGGDNGEKNLVVACRDCNIGKSSQSINPFDVCLEFDDGHQEELSKYYRELDQYLTSKEKGFEIRNQMVRRMASFWNTLAPGWDFTDHGWDILNTLAKTYNSEIIISSLETAAAKHLVYLKDGKVVTEESRKAAFLAARVLCEQKAREARKKFHRFDNLWFKSLFEDSRFNERKEISISYLKDKNILDITSKKVILCDQCNQVMDLDATQVIFSSGKNRATGGEIGLIYFSHKNDIKDCSFKLDKLVEGSAQLLVIEKERREIDFSIMDLIGDIVYLFSGSTYDKSNLYESVLRLTIDNFDIAYSIWVDHEGDTNFPNSRKNVLNFFHTIGVPM